MTRSSSFAIFINLCLLIIITSSILSCSGNKTSSPPKVEINVETPTGSDIDSINQSGSVDLNAPAIEVPTITKLQEECDGSDNNNNNLYDEYCYSCCLNAKKGDFDCNGTVTMYDCNAPMLVAYSATILKGTDRTCIDLNSDGVVNLSDTLACIDIVNAGGVK